MAKGSLVEKVNKYLLVETKPRIWGGQRDGNLPNSLGCKVYKLEEFYTLTLSRVLELSS